MSSKTRHHAELSKNFPLNIVTRVTYENIGMVNDLRQMKTTFKVIPYKYGFDVKLGHPTTILCKYLFGAEFFTFPSLG